MKRTLIKSLSLILVSSAACGHTTPLKDSWTLHSSKEIGASGEVISKPGFAAAGWYSVKAPSTVVGALVDAKLYTDPFSGMNLRKIPGTTYPSGGNFTVHEIPADSPFAVSWWYRTEFQISPRQKSLRHFLRFNGINYSANIWLNGNKIADQSDVEGSFRSYEFDVTHLVQGKNALAIEVFPQPMHKLATTWIDWSPSPPDKNMGLWQNVELVENGILSLRNGKVFSKVPNLNEALLTVQARVINNSDQEQKAVLVAHLMGKKINQAIELSPHQERLVVFDTEHYPALHIQRPQLWWPRQMGKASLHELHLTLESHHTVSDQQKIRFGIREVSSELDKNGHRLFRINGKAIMIRGGGWSNDLFLRPQPERENQELRYVMHLGLNTVRFEGQVASEYILDLADEQGILIMPGWPCCSHWEEWDNWSQKDPTLAGEALRSQLRRYVNHPSVFVWLYGSDEAPPERVEKIYLDVIRQESWPNPTLSSASNKNSIVGNSGVKMTGPYQYVPPSYWSTDDSRGGAFGFNTETSCGPAIPPLESLREMLPSGHLWPRNEFWAYHAGADRFQDLEIFSRALDSRYGKARDLEDYALKSQVMAYDGHRAMFEAYSATKYKNSTGLIQWMLNNAWPSMIWHLYDYYLRPGGSYFGAKKANEPLHIQYIYGDQSIYVVNQTYQDHGNLKAHVEVFDFELRPRFSKVLEVNIPTDSSQKILSLPRIPLLSQTYFVRLRLEDKQGHPVSGNFYWLSTQKEEMNWGASDFTGTPTLVEADLHLLQNLPKVALKVQLNRTPLEITIENPTRKLAFFTHFKIEDARGQEILPVLWEDNYITLMPGEKRTIRAEFMPHQHQAHPHRLVVDGWNIIPFVSKF